VPKVPPGSEAVVIERAGAVIEMLRFADLVAWVGVCESVAVTVKLVVPVNVPEGVPEITPVAAFRVRPAGKLPVETLHV
jgi:hypothetical protein